MLMDIRPYLYWYQSNTEHTTCWLSYRGDWFILCGISVEHLCLEHNILAFVQRWPAYKSVLAAIHRFQRSEVPPGPSFSMLIKWNGVIWLSHLTYFAYISALMKQLPSSGGAHSEWNCMLDALPFLYTLVIESQYCSLNRPGWQFLPMNIHKTENSNEIPLIGPCTATQLSLIVEQPCTSMFNCPSKQ